MEIFGFINDDARFQCTLTELILQARDLTMGRFIPPYHIIMEFLKFGKVRWSHWEVFSWSEVPNIQIADYKEVSSRLNQFGFEYIDLIGRNKLWAWHATMHSFLAGGNYSEYAKLFRVISCVDRRIREAIIEKNVCRANQLREFLVDVCERFPLPDLC